MPTMQPVKSSNVESVGHDPQTNTMTIKFRSQPHAYDYYGVSPEKFTAALQAPSIGAHLSANIVKQHKFKKHEAPLA